MNKDIFEIAKSLKNVSETPLLDARLLTAEAFDEKTLTDFIQKRMKGEPVAKILGHKGFWKGDFKTDKNTLDPRPDSETMIEAVLQKYPDKKVPLRILDLGTGTGCLILSLLEEYPLASGTGIDISKKALAVARENGKNCARADFIQADIQNLSCTPLSGPFDMIISNPPYIPTEELSTLSKETLSDPITALDGGKDGLDFYRIFARALPALCHTKTSVFLEIGKGQETTVKEIMQKNFAFKQEWKDLGGIVRILLFQKIKKPF